MGNRHVPEPITLKQLTEAKQELLTMADVIDSTVATMKKQKIDQMWMFNRSSFDGVNGGIVRLRSFIAGMDMAKRRLMAGNPIVEGERKRRSTAEDPPSRSTSSNQPSSDDTVVEAFQQALKAMAPEVRKRIAETMGEYKASGSKSRKKS